MNQIDVYSKKVFYIFLIIASVVAIFTGIIILLKLLSPILLPITFIYVFSVVLRTPYIAIKEKIKSEKISFLIVMMIFLSIMSLVIYKFGSDIVEQYKLLSSSIIDNMPKIISNIKTNSPVLADLLKKLNLEQNIGILLNGNVIDSIITTTSKVISSIGNGTFSLVMAIVTWIVIPSFIYSLVTKPLEERDIISWFSLFGNNISKAISEIFIKFRDNLEIYFFKQLVISILHFITLLVLFYTLEFSTPIVLALIFAILNLIPNLGSTMLILSSPIIAILYNVNSHGIPENYGLGVLLSGFLGLGILILDNILFSNFLKYISKYITNWQQESSIHPAIITFSIIFWGYLLDGIFGLVLSVPITILVKTTIEYQKNKNTNKFEEANEKP